MEAVWQIVALGLLGAVLAALLKKHTPELALLLAKGYAALDSRPYGGSLALALYPLKETE
jgi:hypothetical protein